MNATLVYDGTGPVRIPPTMGSPCPNQMTGTPLENLGEVSSRICYDSLGLDENGKARGRSTEKLHEHILEVRNHSVYEHCNFTLRFHNIGHRELLTACANRRGVWVAIKPGGATEVTASFRAVIEWPRHTGTTNLHHGPNWAIGHCFRNRLAELAPLLARHLPEWEPAERLHRHDTISVAPVEGEDLTDDQAWVSLWLYGSRGYTHEQVRHRYAMSQRSTRYVDEDGSPYIIHPLVEKYLADQNVDERVRDRVQLLISESVNADRSTYRTLVEVLQLYGVEQGLDKITARKQARGASRGYLGNALASEMIYSAPLSGWKWILSQRKSQLADAEIRAVYTPGLEALRSSRYGDRFSHYTTVPSPDGLGTVLS